MYNFITKQQNLSSLPAKKNIKNNNLSCKPVNNTLLLMKRAHHKNTNISQNAIIQCRQYTITRSIRSNLWSEELRAFLRRNLSLIALSMRRTDYVGGFWEVRFTYDTSIVSPQTIDRVISQVPLNRQVASSSSSEGDTYTETSDSF